MKGEARCGGNLKWRKEGREKERKMRERERDEIVIGYGARILFIDFGLG